MKPETKRKLTKRLALTQILIYCFIIVHVVFWHVFGIHVVSKLCPFVFDKHIGNLEFNINVVFWLLVFASTLMFGRAFCAWGCMFGAYQDFLSRLTKKFNIKPMQAKAKKILISIIIAILITAYVFSSDVFWPSLFAFAAIVTICGLAIWIFAEKDAAVPKIWTLPKYIYFAQYLGGIVIMWLTLDILHKGVTLAFDKYDVLHGLQLGSAIFIAVLVAAGIFIGEKRMFCKYICPIGLILRFISVLPFPTKYKVRLDGDACTNCGKCNRECLMGLEPMAEIKAWGVVKNSNCINCLACVATCPQNALDFKAN